MASCQLKEDTKVHITAGDHTLYSESSDPKTDCSKRTGDYNPTAVYIPAKHNAKATELNVLLWMHGFYVTDHKNIFSPDKDYDPKLRESVSKACEDSGKDVILIAPYLGHRYRAMGDDGKMHSTGDSSGIEAGGPGLSGGHH